MIKGDLKGDASSLDYGSVKPKAVERHLAGTDALQGFRGRSNFTATSSVVWWATWDCNCGPFLGNLPVAACIILRWPFRGIFYGIRCTYMGLKGNSTRDGDHRAICCSSSIPSTSCDSFSGSPMGPLAQEIPSEPPSSTYSP